VWPLVRWVTGFVLQCMSPYWHIWRPHRAVAASAQESWGQPARREALGARRHVGDAGDACRQAATTYAQRIAHPLPRRRRHEDRFICDNGFNIVASATRAGHKLIAVVFGEATVQERGLRAANLLEHGFRTYAWKALFCHRHSKQSE